VAGGRQGRQRHGTVSRENRTEGGERMAIPTISVVTMCKGRRSQALKMIPHTLSLLLAGDEIVFVDYSCPQDTGRLINANYVLSQQLRCVWVPGRRWWNPAHARNCGAVNARGDILLFVDIDNIVPKVLYEKCREVPQEKFYALLPALNKSGFMAINRRDFFKINGYEEGLAAYGYEDTSTYRALDLAKIGRVDLKEFDVDVLEPDNQYKAFEPCRGDVWIQNQDITTILRQRHEYRNNIGVNWGVGWKLEP
jgi:glycosyltransferase involved in cell wall biosynthesis